MNNRKQNYILSYSIRFPRISPHRHYVKTSTLQYDGSWKNAQKSQVGSASLIPVSYHDSETDRVCTITLLFLCHGLHLINWNFFCARKTLHSPAPHMQCSISTTENRADCWERWKFSNMYSLRVTSEPGSKCFASWALDSKQSSLPVLQVCFYLRTFCAQATNSH